MNKSQILTSHINSLKLLIVNLVLLPITIYKESIIQLSKKEDNTDSEFIVLNWLLKCYNAMIVLSYTIGLIVVLLCLTKAIDNGYPVWQQNYDYGGSPVAGYYDYEEYTYYSGDYNYTEEEFYAEQRRYEASVNKQHFQVDAFLILLLLIYCSPLFISLFKELFSLVIVQNRRLKNIEENTKKQ